MGDNLRGTHEKRIAWEMETCIGLLPSTEDHSEAGRRALADLSVRICPR
jgi:hypothetical protein